MAQKRIAAFSTDWNFEISYLVHKGMEDFLNENPDYNIFSFDCFAKLGETNNDIAEAEIFKLADMSAFDGVLIQGNQILDEPIRNGLVERVKKAGIPIISLCYQIEGIPFINIDNYAAMKELTSHLIEHHHVTKLAFLTGYKESSETQERLNGFMDSCYEHHLNVKDIQLLDGRWEYEHGKAAAEKLLKDWGHMPEALICANDDMAIGACETFQRAGIRIPEDIIVTGFDNIGDAMAYQPRLTTISRDYRNMAYTAMYELKNHIEGIHTDVEKPDHYAPIFSGSCGCHDNSRTEEELIRKRFFKMNRFTNNYSRAQEDMVSRMMDAGTYAEVLDILESYGDMFRVPQVICCSNRTGVEDTGDLGRITGYSDEIGILAYCGSRHIDHDENHSYGHFSKKEMLPASFVRPGKMYIFYPVHYREYSLGYMVFEGASPAIEYNLLEGTLRFIESVYENMRQKYLLRELNESLNSLYVKDSLTGLYNRFGFEQYAKKTVDDIVRSGGKPAILFADMDDMKSINDDYGHEVGDIAIKTIGSLLQEVLSDTRSFVMRYGGDEFLAITDITGHNYRAKINHAVKKFDKTKKYPFHLSLSVGQVLINDLSIPLDEYVSEADSRMYEIKKKKKIMRKN